MTSREILQGSFLKFLWYVWKNVLLLPEPTRVQYDIARFLVGGKARRFIQAFRGIGKTFITGAYVVWRLWKNPDMKVLIVSANEAFATEIATFIWQIIHHESGDGLWDELQPRQGQRKSTLAFDVGPAKADKSPSVKAAGITGQITGSRADLIMSDDVEVPKNSETETMREKLEDKTKEYAAIIKPGGEIVYLGTPQSEQSIYRKLPSKGYEVRVWPARYPLRSKLANYAGILAPILRADIEADETLMNPVGSSIGGAPVDPERFTDLDLIERENEYREAGFLLQYQLDTSLTDKERYPLKTNDLIVLDLDRKVAPARLVWGSGPDQIVKDVENVGMDGDRFNRPIHIGSEYLPYSGSVMHVDPSGRGRDRTTYAITKFLHGYVFLAAWGGFKDGYGDDTLSSLARLSQEHEVNLISPEDNFGDGMFGKLLETHVNRLRPCRIEGHRVHGMKEERIINSLHPLMRQHRLVVDLGVIREDLRESSVIHSGIYQMTHIAAIRGALKHDDKIDVLAMAASYWAEYLNADAKKAEEDRAQRERDAFLYAHLSGQIMAPPPAPRGIAGRRGRGRPSRAR